jgi:hypothetical protein
MLFTETVRVRHAGDFAHWYLDNVSRGPDYYEPRETETDSNELRFGDLAWAVLLEGQPRSRAAQSLLKVAPYDISSIPRVPLEELDSADLATIEHVIVELIDRTDGIAPALATKMLHPKRRATVPVCDNKAIFGSFLRPAWRPGEAPRGRGTVLAALDAIHHCLTRPENQPAWDSLHAAYPRYQRVELFDMTWWTVLRNPAGLVQTGSCYELLRANGDERGSSTSRL